MSNNKEDSNVFMISDIHFGVKNNNLEWFNNQLNYFENFLIPKFTKNDILFILGDIFDNRSSVNIFVLHKIINQLFRKLSESVKEIHILTGNHDMYFKDNNSVTIIDLLKYDNVRIYKDPTLVTIDKQDFLFVPYYEDKLMEQEVMRKFRNSKTICLMHADISGFYYTKNIIADHTNSNDSSVYAGYKHIYSGHFHIRQTKKNITYIGSPYHIDKNDIGNEKGIYYFDSKFNVDFIPNDYSPKFIKLNSDDVLNKEFTELNEIMNNNYVDIIVDKDDIESLDIYNRISLYKTAKDINVQIIEKEKDFNIVYDETSKFDLIKLFESFMQQAYNINEIDLVEYVDYVNEKYDNIKKQ